MPWGPRVFETSGNTAEGDKLFVEGQYSGPSGQLTAFMPLYKDCGDAAEYNALTTTKLTTAFNFVGDSHGAAYGGFTNTNPPQTAGRVTLSAYAAAGSLTPGVTSNPWAGAISTGVAPVFVGVYNPTNPTDRPSTGDVVRMVRFGVSPIQISSGGSTFVGDVLVATQSYPFAQVVSTSLTGTQISAGGNSYIGRVIATGGAISTGSAINPGIQGGPTGATAGATGWGFLVNAWIDR